MTDNKVVSHKDFLKKRMEKEVGDALENYLEQMRKIDAPEGAATISAFLAVVVFNTFNYLTDDSAEWREAIDRHAEHVKAYEKFLEFDGASYFTEEIE